MKGMQNAEEERGGAGDAGGDVAENEDLRAARALRAVLQRDRHPTGLERGPHRAAEVHVGVALAAPQLVTLGGETALELCHHPVNRGQVLDRTGGQSAIELRQRALGRQRGRALDQITLQLASQVLLEPP